MNKECENKICESNTEISTNLSISDNISTRNKSNQRMKDKIKKLIEEVKSLKAKVGYD